MRAMGVAAPGGEIAELELPVPEHTADEVLIAVQASSINPVDVHVARGFYRIGELDYPLVPGFDVSGIVERVGDAVTRFAPGDPVMGFWSRPGFRQGAWAEHVSLTTETALVQRPSSLGPAEAAAFPLAAVTAVLAVEDVGCAPGETVLVTGAAGAVGCYAVQLAARRGATVIATAKARDAARVASLGAAETIDYEREDVVEAVRRSRPAGVDALIDLVNDKPELERIAEVVVGGGRVASARFAAKSDLLAGRGITSVNVSAATVGAEALAPLVALVDSGELSVMLTSVRPLAELPAAVEEFGRGGRGKIAIAVSRDAA